MPTAAARDKAENDKKAMSPEDDIVGLRKDIKRSLRELKTYRDHRRDAIEFYVGTYWADLNQEKGTVVPIGILNLFVDIHTSKLAADAPRALVTTKRRELKSDATTLGLAVDRDIARMDLGRTLRTEVKDAMFSLGINCTALVNTGEVSIQGEEDIFKVGDSVAYPIDLDDFVCDMDARAFDQCYYIGHRVRVPLDWAKENKAFDEDERRALKATENYTRASGETGGGEGGGGERVEGLGKDETSGKTEHFVPQVDLWIIYLPRTAEIVMFPLEGKGGALARAEWSGPPSPTGPYRFLGFEWVPSNIMPLPPVAMLRELAEVANDLLFKVTEQAERQKTMLVATKQRAKEAQQIQRSKDGDIVLVDNDIQGQVTEMSTGGIDDRTFATFLQIRDIIYQMGGNLEALGGLGPQSETVGQDKLLTASANQSVKAMGDAVKRFTKRIMQDIAWYRWQDPLGEVHVSKKIPGTQSEVPAVFSADTRKGEFQDYDFNVTVYSMQELVPSERATQLLALWQSVILPSIPMSGGTLRPKVPEFVAKIAKYLGVADDVDDIIETLTAPDTMQEPHQEGPAKPAVTERRYVRENRPGGTRAGKDRVLSEIAAGGNPQKSERAMAGR